MKVCFLVLEPHCCCQIGLWVQPINFGFSTLRCCSGQVLDFGFRPNQRSNLKMTWRCAVLNSSSLLTFSTMPTATASDHRASRADNSPRRAIFTNLAWSEPTRPREAIHVVDRCDARHHPAEQRLAEGFASHRGRPAPLLLALRQPMHARRQDGLNADRHLQHSDWRR